MRFSFFAVPPRTRGPGGVGRSNLVFNVAISSLPTYPEQDAPALLCPWQEQPTNPSLDRKCLHGRGGCLPEFIITYTCAYVLLSARNFRKDFTYVTAAASIFPILAMEVPSRASIYAGPAHEQRQALSMFAHCLV